MFSKFLTLIEKLTLKTITKERFGAFVEVGNIQGVLPNDDYFFVKKILIRLYGLNIFTIFLSAVIFIEYITKTIFLGIVGLSYLYIVFFLTISLLVAFFFIHLYEKTKFKSLWIFIIFSMIAMLVTPVTIVLTAYSTFVTFY